MTSGAKPKTRETLSLLYIKGYDMNKKEIENIKYRFKKGDPLDLTDETIKYYEEEAEKIGTAINGGWNFNGEADRSFVFNLPVSVYSGGQGYGPSPFLKEIIYMPYSDIVWYITPKGSTGWVGVKDLELLEFAGANMEYSRDVDIEEAESKTRKGRVKVLHNKAAKLFFLTESENIVKVNMITENFVKISDKLFLTCN